MIIQEARQIKKDILKDIDSLELKVNPVQRLKIAELIVKRIQSLQIDAVYQYVLNQIREDLEKLYETGKY